MLCPDCKGRKFYQGLFKIETCLACQGSGQIGTPASSTAKAVGQKIGAAIGFDFLPYLTSSLTYGDDIIKELAVFCFPTGTSWPLPLRQIPNVTQATKILRNTTSLGRTGVMLNDWDIEELYLTKALDDTGQPLIVNFCLNMLYARANRQHRSGNDINSSIAYLLGMTDVDAVQRICITQTHPLHLGRLWIV